MRRIDPALQRLDPSGWRLGATLTHITVDLLNSWREFLGENHVFHFPRLSISSCDVVVDHEHYQNTVHNMQALTGVFVMLDLMAFACGA